MGFNHRSFPRVPILGHAQFLAVPVFVLVSHMVPLNAVPEVATSIVLCRSANLRVARHISTMQPAKSRLSRGCSASPAVFSRCVRRLMGRLGACLLSLSPAVFVNDLISGWDKSHSIISTALKTASWCLAADGADCPLVVRDFRKSNIDANEDSPAKW